MNASCAIQIAYSDVDGHTRTSQFGPIGCAYTNQITGAIPVPDGTPSGTEFDVPFVGLATGASLIIIENYTGQEINAAWGGNWAPHLAAGGYLVYAMPDVPTDGCIAGLRFMTTAPQVGAGKITFYAFGK
jgi:hypothetical protein